jgi:hypothetical protein
VRPICVPIAFTARLFTHRYPVIGGNRRHTVEINLDALRRLGIYPDKDRRRWSWQSSIRRSGSRRGPVAIPPAT